MIYFLILRKKNSRYFNFNYALYLFFIMNIIALYLTLHKISIDDLSISSVPISRRSSRSRKCFKVGDGAAPKKEGRKEESHATDPYLSPEFSRDRTTRNNKGRGRRRSEERSAKSRRETGKRRAAWTKPLQRLAFVAEANSPSALFVAAPTPCCHYTIVCVRARSCQWV